MLEIPKLEEPDDRYGIDCSRISNFEITKFEEPDGLPDTQTDIPIFSVSNEILNDNLRTFPKKPEKRRRNDTDNDGEEEEDGIEYSKPPRKSSRKYDEWLDAVISRKGQEYRELDTKEKMLAAYPGGALKQDPKNWTSKEAKRHEIFLENQKFDLSRRGIVLISKLCKSELTENEVNRLETVSNSTFTIYDVPGRGGFYKIEIKGSTGPEDVRKACDVIDAFCWHTIEENFRKFGVQQEYWCHIPEKVQRSRDFKEKMLGLIMKTGVRCLTYRKSWAQHNDPIHFYGYPDMLKNAKNALDKIFSDFYHQKIYKIEAKFVGEVMGKSGVNLKEIQRKTNTNIKISNEIAKEGTRDVVIRGDEQCVEKAWMWILKIIEKRKKEEKEKEDVKKFEFSANPFVTEEMEIPLFYVPRILGKRGSKIRQIHEASGANLFFEEFEIKGHKTLKISGTQQKYVDRAVREVEDVMRRCEKYERGR
ncbi:hypothetical protein L5515_005550 [Caenorhabditis briggsae]|uniref:K Homology domain-containing protein n=1 Tax=Caenorhabditis briggsae TaxID=6238 RepID=A0AAE9EKM4_CAEBR|nr:hypothetical protein L5515_005550 [Caenorhabditis briggsae]